MEPKESKALSGVVTPPKYVSIILRASVFVTSLGYLYRYSNDNLKAFSQIYFEWGFAERTADIAVDIMQGALLLALVAVPFRKLRFLTIPGFCALLFEVLCLCVNSNTMYPLLVVPCQALRLAPFALIIMPWNKQRAIWILKIAIAATFAGHGIEALFTYAEFVDYILAFFQLIRFPIREVSAATILHVIGTIDVLLAHHVIFYNPQRNKWVLRYMMAWGLITALSRIMYYGFGAWHEVAIRNAHFLIIYLLICVVNDFSTKGEFSEEVSGMKQESV